MNITSYVANQLGNSQTFLRKSMSLLKSSIDGYDVEDFQEIGKKAEYSIRLVETSTTRLPSSYQFVVALKRGNVVGGMRLFPLGDSVMTADTFLVNEHRGMGLGKAMLRAVVDHYGTVRSSVSLSDAAARLWKSLSNELDVVLVAGGHEVRIRDWTRSNFPIVSDGDKEVSLETLLKKGSSESRTAARESFFLVRK